MRISPPLRYAAILCTAAATLFPALAAHAQKFQPPTKEELQMTADPKAPGAAAVYLYREEETSNQAHYVTAYVRLKVLTEAGKEYAAVELPYIKGFSEMPIIEARTIHADGTIIPLTGKPEDLVTFKNTERHVSTAVFTMPSVEVGSILEYRWTVPMGGTGKWGNALESQEGLISSAMASQTPQWHVQTPLFIHKAHFYFNPFTNLEQSDLAHRIIYYADGEQAHYLLFTANLPPGAKVDKSPKGDYSLDVQDVPPMPRESNSPPESSFLYRVRFFWTPYPTAQIYWENEIARWSKQEDQLAAQTDALKQAAAQIIASAPVPATTPDAKARQLYEAVQALDNTSFTRPTAQGEPQRANVRKDRKKAQDVWTGKSGSPNDLAVLYLALARAAGLEAYAIKVADRNQRIFDPNLLALSQLDSLLVVLEIDGKDVFLDPGQKLCPYGQLAWNHALAGGLQQNIKTAIFTPASLSKDSITAHSADLTVDEHGSITGSLKIMMNGPEALRWRQLNLTADPAELHKQFNQSLRQLLPHGVDGELDQLQGLDKADTASAMLLATAKVHGQLGLQNGRQLLLPAFFFSTNNHLQFGSESTRTIPVDLHYPQQVIDDVLYHFPAAYHVESAPPPTQLPWPAHAALVTKTTSAPGVIDIKHTFARTFVFLDIKEYPTLHDYYQKLATNDQQQLVLTAASTPSGN